MVFVTNQVPEYLTSEFQVDLNLPSLNTLFPSTSDFKHNILEHNEPPSFPAAWIPGQSLTYLEYQARRQQVADYVYYQIIHFGSAQWRFVISALSCLPDSDALVFPNHAYVTPEGNDATLQEMHTFIQ